MNYRYEALSYRLTEKLMSPFLIEISPNQPADLPLSSHEGEEFLFLLAGELIVTIEDHQYAMRAGDSLYFDSRLKHTVQPTGSQPARLIACIAQDHKQQPASPMERSF
jgi:mannose-6-phosphate isomerase-like protein (cupin superfamily)